MSESSTRLGLPYLAAGQAQKHVTVNESLLRLDALTQLSARSASLAAQPSSPTDGDIYLLPAGKTGAAWGAMAEGALAYYRDGVWEELVPQPGWRCFVEDAEALYARGSGSGVWCRVAAADERRLKFTPGGTGVVSIYRNDTTRVQNPRTAVISSVSGDVITLTSADSGLFFNNTYMSGVCYLRIWNTSKTPDQSAWVKAQPANNQLTVVSAAALSGWANGETIQIGDPTDQTPNRVIALDISPMMQAVVGRVFRQAGVLLDMGPQGVGAVATIDASADGATGSFTGVKSLTDGTLQVNQVTLASSALSPVSNSNLVFLRESVTGTAMGITIANVVGLWV